MMSYIMDNNLDTYTTLQILAGDQRTCFDYRPLRIGVQDSAVMTLDTTKLEYTEHVPRTPEVKQLTDTISALPLSINLKGWRIMRTRIQEFLISTFNEQLTWGATFWE